MQPYSKNPSQRHRHQRIHCHQANGESQQSHESLGCPAQAGSQQKQHQLARRLRAQSVQNANRKNRSAAVIPREGYRPWRPWFKKLHRVPPCKLAA